MTCTSDGWVEDLLRVVAAELGLCPAVEIHAEHGVGGEGEPTGVMQRGRC